MSSYRVFDQCPLGLEIALRDGTGRFHIARTSSDVPPVGTELAGLQPRRGQGTVLAAKGGQMFPVTLQVVDCGLQTIFDRLHPAP